MSEIKSFSFPVLSPDSIDYSDECAYGAEAARSSNSSSVSVSHRLDGGGLVSQLVKNGQAAFACIVSLPATMYRRVEVADSTDLAHVQTIDYSQSGYGQDTVSMDSPMFRPVVLTTEKVEQQSVARDRLAFHWAGAGIVIPKGSIIAYDEWQRFGGSEGGLFEVEEDPNLADGQMRVQEETNNGYRFRIFVGARLYESIKESVPGARHYEHRNSVLTHALSIAFNILKQDLNLAEDKAWKEHVNLRLIAEKLEQAGQRHWSDGEDFDPEVAATALYPHIFPEDDSGEDEYD